MPSTIIVLKHKWTDKYYNKIKMNESPLPLLRTGGYLELEIIDKRNRKFPTLFGWRRLSLLHCVAEFTCLIALSNPC